jgi:hypothetical protein
MIEDLPLRGMVKRTQELSVRAVRQLAEHYHKSPAYITEEALRRYFLDLKHVKYFLFSMESIGKSNGLWMSRVCGTSMP